MGACLLDDESMGHDYFLFTILFSPHQVHEISQQILLTPPAVVLFCGFLCDFFIVFVFSLPLCFHHHFLLQHSSQKDLACLLISDLAWNLQNIKKLLLPGCRHYRETISQGDTNVMIFKRLIKILEG